MVGAVLVLLATLDGPSEPPVPIIQGGKSAEEVVSEGLTFYAEGDYQRAASWLGLVALAAPPHLSAAADFALADVSERGLGVPQTCGAHTRCISTPAHRPPTATICSSWGAPPSRA